MENSEETAAATPEKPSVRLNRFLPYWAVFQADLRQTLRSWIYRGWVFFSLSAAIGFLLYRYGAKQVAGMVQQASDLMSDLLHWTVWGSVTLIIVLTAGTICSERATIADAVLSRGISRFQFFLGKWHARLAVILVTFLLIAGSALVGAYFLLHGENLSLVGSLLALAMVAALLMVVVSCGVTISAVTNNPVVSIAVLWMVLYGAGFVLSFLPAQVPSPDRALQNLPSVMRGVYDQRAVGHLIGGAVGLSVVVAMLGMFFFSRRDV